MDAVFLYKGKFPTHQPTTVVEAFTTFLTEEKPDRIIEIGTAYGGCTLILADIANTTAIYTYDNRDVCWHRTKNKKNVTTVVGDVFSQEIHDQIKGLIQSEGKVLLLCDGGNKVKEFNTFAPYLKSGDMIMAHDYAGRTCDWQWVEISDDDIEDVVEDERLQPNKQDVMGAAAWVSYKRA